MFLRYAVILDEISSAPPQMLGNLEVFLRQLMPDQENVEFGGLAVVLLGDMMQLPPVGQSYSLYESTVSPKVTKRPNPPAEHGLCMFNTFLVKALDEQMRAADDPRHMSMLNCMRNPKAHTGIRIDMDYFKQ